MRPLWDRLAKVQVAAGWAPGPDAAEDVGRMVEELRASLGLMDQPTGWPVQQGEAGQGESKGPGPRL